MPVSGGSGYVLLSHNNTRFFDIKRLSMSYSHLDMFAISTETMKIGDSTPFPNGLNITVRHCMVVIYYNNNPAVIVVINQNDKQPNLPILAEYSTDQIPMQTAIYMRTGIHLMHPYFSVDVDNDKGPYIINVVPSKAYLRLPFIIFLKAINERKQLGITPRHRRMALFLQFLQNFDSTYKGYIGKQPLTHL
jgi:hypothetical protein